jgi:1-deoxy-D-xylulose-5-phosphate synthase
MTGENYDNLVADYLVEKMKKDPSVFAMCAAVPATIGFDKAHREAAGKQFIDVDICEQHLLSMAAGVARNGGKPVVATFSTFYQRAYDQIAQDICINKCPVTILVRNGSIWAGNDVTHLGWFDLALFSNVPNLVYLCPTNCEEYFAMLDWSIEQKDHPILIRIPRGKVIHTEKEVEKDYSDLNKFLVTQKGEKVAIIAMGDFYPIGENVAAAIKEKLGFVPTLINPRFASGLDSALLDKLKENHDIVVTLEDSILDGGFGQKVASFYGCSTTKVLNYGLKKEFLDGYDAKEVLIKYGISSDLLIHDIVELDLI